MAISVIDYGLGNIQSVANALRFLGYEIRVSSSRHDLAGAQAYVLPGVGAFGEGMKNLNRLGLVEPLAEQVLSKKKPIIGFCLGMQLFAEDSTELGFHQGLGWIKGHIEQMPASDKARIPHVGWNDVTVRRNAPLFARTDDKPKFYFDHSFHFICPESHIAATCDHGMSFVAAVQKDNIFGVQFHPEKSQRNGLKLLRGLFDSFGIAYAQHA